MTIFTETGLAGSGSPLLLLRFFISILKETEKIVSKLIFSSGQDFDKNFLESKHVLKVYFKPRRKNSDFGFLPLPAKPVSVKNCHLSLAFFITTVIFPLFFLSHKRIK